MKKLWSITTTVRSPERVVGFLNAAVKLSGVPWNKETQTEFQARLIAERKYTFEKKRADKLPPVLAALYNDKSKDISLEQAKEMFVKAKYVAAPIRGRTSMSVLTKLGLVFVGDGVVSITKSGLLLLGKDSDIHEILFRRLLKWQIPNPTNKKYPANGEYNIKPLIGTLHLIHKINQAEESAGRPPKGISEDELRLFTSTLLHHKNIDSYVEKIIKRRELLSEHGLVKKNKNLTAYDKAFLSEFLNTDNQKRLGRLRNNLVDYGDNTRRYFCRAGYCVRTENYINFSSTKMNAILSLLASDAGASLPFASPEERKRYDAHIADI